MTEQRTPAIYKALQLVGVLVLIVGVVLRVDGEIYGTGLGVLGALLYTVGRIAAWLKAG